jgi:hypothetical protein
MRDRHRARKEKEQIDNLYGLCTQEQRQEFHTWYRRVRKKYGGDAGVINWFDARQRESQPTAKLENMKRAPEKESE